MNFIQTKTFRLYLLSVFIYFSWALTQREFTLDELKIFLPLLFSFLIIFSYKLYLEKFNKVFAYILFFSISFTSLFGITNVMDGSFALSTNPILFGLAFYSVFFAFHIYKKTINLASESTLSSVILAHNIFIHLPIIPNQSSRFSI